MNCNICVAKTKALISCAVTAQLICVFVFAYAKAGFLTTKLILFQFRDIEEIKQRQLTIIDKQVIRTKALQNVGVI